MNWLLIGSTVLTVLFLIFYILHIIRRHKLEKAIFEIRDLLRDIKDAQFSSRPTPVATTQPEATSSKADVTTP